MIAAMKTDTLTRFSLAAIVTAAVLALGSSASADTYSVTPSDGSSLQAALTAAGMHSGDDTVAIPAGTYVGNFDYTFSNPVQIVGGGMDHTKLISASGGGATLNLNAPASSVRNLSIEVTVGPGSPALRLTLGGTVDGVRARAAAFATLAVDAADDMTLSHAEVEVTQGTTAVRQDAGALTVSDSTITGVGTDNYGIDVAGFVTADIGHVRTAGVIFPVSSVNGAATSVHDSLFVLPPVINATALSAGDFNNAGVNFVSSLQADRLTVIGQQNYLQTGAEVSPNSAGDNFTVAIRDSVLTGFSQPLNCGGSPGAGHVSADYSSLPSGGDNNGCASGGASRTHPVTGTPRFVDAASGDYRLTWDSPLVDAGDPGMLTAALDLGGMPRPVGRGDVGAYEYQRRAPSVSATAAPAPGSLGNLFAFAATASDPDPGDSPLAYEWQFDDGASATGASVTHAFTTLGEHAATVTVTDPAGANASKTVTVDVSAVPASAEPVPPSADVPAAGDSAADRTAPTVSGLRVRPKRVVIGSLLPRLTASATTPRISFSVSEPAALTIRFARRSGGRYVPVRGSIHVTVHAGRSAIRFAGRLSRRVALRSGTYRASLVARDAARNVSAPARTGFALVLG
jgi:hypothetical protein